MQVQIQALLVAQEGAEGATTGPNVGSHMEVAKPAIFNREAGRVGGFILACRLYIKMKLRGNTVEEQVQCYDLKSLEWNSKTTLVLSNTRELNRKLFYKLVYLI